MRLTHSSYRSLFVAIALAVTLALPCAATAQEKNWTLRVQGTWSSPTGEFDLLGSEGQRVNFSPNQPLGFAVGLEYRPIERVGFEFSGMYSRPTIDAAAIYLDERVEASADMLFMPLSGAVNLHMTPEKAVDVYAGAMFLWAVYGDLKFVVPGEGSTFLRGQNDPGWGLQAGVDVPIGGHGWSFSAAIKYMSTNFTFTDVEDGSDFEMKFNPFVLGFGVSGRF